MLRPRRIAKVAVVLAYGFGVARPGGATALVAAPPELRGEEQGTAAATGGKPWDSSAGSPRVSAYRLSSAILGEERRIRVALPPSFPLTGRRYPVVVVLDGEMLFEPALVAASWLGRLGHVPEAIVVGVDNTNRRRDLTPPGLSVSGSSDHEGGDRFLDFLERELLPAVAARFRGGPLHVLVGLSSGAILTTYAAATRSGVFPFTVALDAPIHLGDDWLAARMVERARAGGPPLRYASVESKFGWSDGSWRQLQGAAPGSWKLYRFVEPEESHESLPLFGTYIGLREVFADYSMNRAPARVGAAGLAAYRAATAAYGMEVPPPAPWLRRALDEAIGLHDAATAERLLEELVAGYGRPVDGEGLAARVAALTAAPPSEETVEGLLATPIASPAELAPYVGTWKGSTWIDPAGTNAVELRLHIADGKAGGEWIRRPRPDLELVEPLTYLRVTAKGLTFGFLNGMYPRGVLLHEATLEGDRLAGEVRFGGIGDFRGFNGERPPVVHFALQRTGP